MRYDTITDGEWIRPIRRGYKVVCCDCGLTHVVDFDTRPHGKGREIVFRVFRDERATAAVRREATKREKKETDTHGRNDD